ncbi:uncharacterized protein [Dendrobates tinctorius]|uniref:uncharacterized protein n=1 Tax=Dendrobates tinctorius TaxID=92724 RepID=UPI003CC9A400
MILLPVALLFLLCREGRGRRLIPHVTAPETWQLGVTEKVLVRTSQQLESFPVTVSLVSYPDKKTTFSSALLALTPDNRFRGAVMLSVKAEDSPGEFVYLVVESKVFREDRRIPVTDAARATMDEPDISTPRRRRRQSLLTATQIQHLTEKFQNPNILRCCLNGANYYMKHENCESEQNDALKRSKPHCKRAYEECCNYSEGQMVKVLPIGASPGIAPFPAPHVISEYVHVPATSRHVDDTILITVTQSSARRAVTNTFTVKIDPTQDVSVQLRSTMFNTNINVSFQTLPPADGDQ